MWEGAELSKEQTGEFAGSTPSVSQEIRGDLDPELLQRALLVLAEANGHDAPVRWIIGTRINRRRSTLYPLFAKLTSGATVPAYYKIKQRDDGLAETRSPARPSRVSSLILTERLAARSVQEGIVPARILVVDASRRVVITLKAPGRALGKAVHWLLPRWGFRPRGVYRKVGRAIRLVEECSDPDLSFDHTIWTAQLESLAHRCRPVLAQAEIDRLTARLDGLYWSTVATGEKGTHVHGDLSNSNVLVHRGGISLIDMTWDVRFRGYDLAYFALRMRYETPRIRRWTEMLIDAMIEGYGDPGLQGRPGWQLAYLYRLALTASHGIQPAVLDLKPLLHEG